MGLRWSETDLRCLEILLQELPEASPTQLADRLGLTTGSTTTLLDRLEKAGYLARQPHPTDQRKSIIRATPEFQKTAFSLMAPPGGQRPPDDRRRVHRRPDRRHHRLPPTSHRAPATARPAAAGHCPACAPARGPAARPPASRDIPRAMPPEPT
ncbi:MarR family transcriptional regulator [Streptomyces sp. NPDC056660]|uniref:MarR family transcriptional regulator n=1 Tax=Streptomyces sp. NPDC056660 TaxID=3345897 RepID=UPI0036A5C2C8